MEQLALRIEALQASSDEDARVPALTRASRDGVLPLSFAQQRLWFLDQLEPGSASYNVPILLTLRGALVEDVLERSFQELVRRHESLRTVFRTQDGAPVQVILPVGTSQLEQVDLSGLPEAEREAEARRRAEHEAMRPFDLETGPLLRTTLLKLAPKEYLLVLVLHHIVSDGWTMGVLVREMSALYEGFRQGQPVSLPELPVQYADYAVWQRSWLQGEVLEAQIDWWKQHLSGAPPVLELPTDFQRPAVQSYRGDSCPVHLPQKLSEALKARCQEEGVTPFMALLATYQLLLSRYSGQEDITVGSPIAGRRRGELEGLVGFFVNTLALRTRLEGNPSFRQVLARVKETTLGAFAHQDIPFEKLVEELAPSRTLGHSPLFQVIFALQNAPVGELQLPDFSMQPLPLDNATARFELELSLSETPDGFAGELTYCRDLFSSGFAQRFCRHFAILLEGLLSQPERPFRHLPLLSPEERQTVLVEWNPSPSSDPRDSSINDVFARQAAASPEAIAVEHAAQCLTYRQLDEASNRLAWLLRARGVGPDSRVALALDRSLELIITLLGILKAGGAYVPLDTAYPRERLAFMLEDARPALLVTTREQLSRLPAENLPTLLIEEAADALAQAPTSALTSGVSSRNLAYIDFTSGSTGRPKAVAIAHRGVTRLVLGSSFIHFGPEEVFLQLAPISFDASTLEVWGALLHGARLVLAPPRALSLEDLASLLTRHRVSTLWLT
ncbi:condensation domain-containing protein, partial [Pyxidicoccus sp. 3LFB2]